MILKAWQQVYPDITFPHTHIVIKARNPGRYHVHDVVLSKGHRVRDLPKNFCCITKADRAKYKNERCIVQALKGVFNSKHVNTSNDAHCIFSAFAPSHPTIPTTSQATIIAWSRYTFLMDIKDQLPVYMKKHSRIICCVCLKIELQSSWKYH